MWANFGSLTSLMPTVDAVASEAHYLEHLLPVWEALPEPMRGEVVGARELDTVGKRLRPGGDYALASGYADLLTLYHEATPAPPVIFMEHGAGFTFRDRRGHVLGSYAGADERPNVACFLCPNEFASAANRAAHPDVPSFVVGCPKLDRWHRREPLALSQPPVVAIALHWDCTLAAGTRSALDHFRFALRDLVCDDWTLLVHGHPRAAIRNQLLALELGVEFVSTLDEVFERANLMVADATSAMYEFASLGRPVVTLNAPWYREEPDAGLRFWHDIPGLQVDDPTALRATVERALLDPAEARELRLAAVDAAYPVRGNAAEVAAQVIEEFVA